MALDPTISPRLVRPSPISVRMTDRQRRVSRGRSSTGSASRSASRARDPSLSSVSSRRQHAAGLTHVSYSPSNPPPHPHKMSKLPTPLTFAQVLQKPAGLIEKPLPPPPPVSPPPSSLSRVNKPDAARHAPVRQPPAAKLQTPRTAVASPARSIPWKRQAPITRKPLPISAVLPIHDLNARRATCIPTRVGEPWTAFSRVIRIHWTAEETYICRRLAKPAGSPSAALFALKRRPMPGHGFPSLRKSHCEHILDAPEVYLPNVQGERKLWVVYDFVEVTLRDISLGTCSLQLCHIATACREVLLGLRWLHNELKLSYGRLECHNVVVTQVGAVKLANFVDGQLRHHGSQREDIAAVATLMEDLDYDVAQHVDAARNFLELLGHATDCEELLQASFLSEARSGCLAPIAFRTFRTMTDPSFEDD